MHKNNILQSLQERELISQITNEKKIFTQLSKKFISVYCGFDPTADSLHLGHLILLLCLKRFQMAGHRPIILIGGATGLIGDPSFKTTERKPNSIEQIRIWIEKIKKQISLFLNFNSTKNSALIVNNYDWFNKIDILTFLKDIGKFFSVNKMINKEAIKQRLHRCNNGISFTEFTYNLLQAYDFAYLNKKYNVTLQIGGSDQWGNITSGIDLTKRMYKNEVYGFTMPLITNANNTKFGKTETNTVWLNSDKTSPFKFYQFLINIPDNDIYRYLKFFTFIDIKKINELKSKKYNNKIRYTQLLLANELTNMVHGKIGLAAAQRITSSLFTESSLNKLKEEDFVQLVKDGIPTIFLQNPTSLQQALVKAKLAVSKKQARTLIESHAIKINGNKKTTTRYILNDLDKLYGHYTLLKKGKRNYSLIYWK